MNEFFLVFDDKIAVKLTDGLTIGRAHSNDEHLTVKDNFLRVLIPTFSSTHIIVKVEGEETFFTLLGQNKTFINDKMMQKGESIELEEGKFAMKQEDICQIVRGDVFRYYYGLRHKNLRSVVYTDRIELNAENLSILGQKCLETLILKRTYYDNILLDRVIDLSSIDIIIPPFDVNYEQMLNFAHSEEILEFLHSIGVSDSFNTLRERTPLKLFLMDRSQLFSGFSSIEHNGNFGFRPNEISVDQAPESVVLLCLIFCDTRELEKYTKTPKMSAKQRESSTEREASTTKCSETQRDETPALEPEYLCQTQECKLRHTTTQAELPTTSRDEFSSSSSSDNIFECKTMRGPSKVSTQLQQLDPGESELYRQPGGHKTQNATADLIDSRRENSCEDHQIGHHAQAQPLFSAFTPGGAEAGRPVQLQLRSMSKDNGSIAYQPASEEQKLQRQAERVQGSREERTITETPIPIEPGPRPQNVLQEASLVQPTPKLDDSRSFTRSKSIEETPISREPLEEPEYKQIELCDGEDVVVSNQEWYQLMKNDEAIAKIKIVYAECAPRAMVNKVTIEDFRE